MATAAAVQRMRGLPEPVGLGTERQHMFMTSFLPPLPSFSFSSSLSHCLSLPSLSSSLLILLIISFFFFLSTCLCFACPGNTCGRLHSTGIKGAWDTSVPQGQPTNVYLINSISPSSKKRYTQTLLFSTLSSGMQSILEYLVQQIISCGCAETLCFIFDAFPTVSDQHLDLLLPDINTRTNHF